MHGLRPAWQIYRPVMNQLVYPAHVYIRVDIKVAGGGFEIARNGDLPMN